MNKKFALASAAAVAGIVLVAAAPARALEAHFSHEAGFESGDVKAGHASAGSVGMKDGDVTVEAGAADGIQIGKTKIFVAPAGGVSIPSPSGRLKKFLGG